MEDYSEAIFKLDKFMPEDNEAQNYFHSLIEEKDVEGMIDFIYDMADFEIMEYYMPDNYSLVDFVKELIG